VLENGIPVDDRTTDVKTAVEWANQTGLLSVGYDGSWYHNSVPTLVWDNPLRFTDSATAGAAQGRTALWPTNRSNMFNVNGSVNLPGRSRASAAVSYGRWSQNEPLLPNTINSALVNNALERSSADTRADITSMVYGFTSRPNDLLWLSAKYRFYNFDNKTPEFDNIATVADYSNGVFEHTEPASFKRHTLDVDASFSPYQYLGVSAGYTREQGDRTFRVFEQTVEDVFRASVDSTGNQYVTARLKVEASSRKGEGLDEELLVDLGEQAQMRHFDIAPRDRHRMTAIVTVTPIGVLDVNVSAGLGRDKYPESYFGLRDNKTSSYSIGFDAAPTNVVSFGADYGFEKYTALQWSRTAAPNTTPPQVTDPTRDWGIDSDDKVHTFTANLDLVKALPKTDIRLSYDLSDGTSSYLYQVPANSTIAAPVQYNTQPKNRIAIVKGDVQYFIRQNVAFGATYWYEQYKVEDFALDPGLLDPLSLPFAFYSGYAFAPYTAHTGSVRVSYLW
jgi:MtrB/PioB family decaheme-associated outer membrane protein